MNEIFRVKHRGTDTGYRYDRERERDTGQKEKERRINVK